MMNYCGPNTLRRSANCDIITQIRNAKREKTGAKPKGEMPDLEP